MTPATAPFDQAEAYRQKGWTGTLPLHVKSKFPPPDGYTGYEGAWPSGADILAWREQGFNGRAVGNVALRMPPAVIGLDVDCYGDKTGTEDIAKLTEQWGPLPATWVSTSRTDGSGIRLYRVTAVVDQAAWPSKAADSIEIIRFAHRYAVVWPSVHDKTGQTYQWISPDGEIVDDGQFPGPGDLPELPVAWLTGLTGHGSTGDHIKPGSRRSRREDEKHAREWLNDLPAGTPCRYVGKLTADLLGAARREDGNAFDNTRDVTLALLRAGETGHPGVRDVLLRGRTAYADAVGSDRGGRAVAEGEFDRFTFGGVAKILDSPGEKAGKGCDCDGDPVIDLGTDPGVSPGSARPRVDVTNSAEAADWLRGNLGAGHLAGMFNRADEIVFCPREGDDGYTPPDDGDDDGPAQVRIVDSSRIASTITWTYQPYKITVSAKGEVSVKAAMFPRGSAQVAVDRPDMVHNLRPMRGVTHTPLVRKDGTLLTRPGYDVATRLLYLPDPALSVPPVPERPTEAQIRAAVAVLDSMIGEFPFVTEHHRANYLGLLVTPLIREITPPPYKAGIINAPQPGSGKTLLATVARITHGGVFRGNVPGDDEEIRKSITTILDQTTGPVVHVDNVMGTLRSGHLAALLTSARWGDRRLGATETVDRANDRVWLFTGNNISVGGDLPRRTVWVTIDPKTPHPERRTGFKIRDLEGWARDNRGIILHALLTLVRAWDVAGRPTGGQPSSDGYSRWVETVAGILGSAGIPGLFDHPDTHLDVGNDDDEWGDFLAAVHGVFGDDAWPVKELLGKFESPNDPWTAQSRPLSLDVLPSELHERVVKARGEVSVISRSLGMWLKHREGRWAGPRVVRKAFTDRNSVAHWKVERAGSAGTTGTNSPYLRGEKNDEIEKSTNGARGNTPRSARSPRDEPQPDGWPEGTIGAEINE